MAVLNTDCEHPPEYTEQTPDGPVCRLCDPKDIDDHGRMFQ